MQARCVTYRTRSGQEQRHHRRGPALEGYQVSRSDVGVLTELLAQILSYIEDTLSKTQ